MTADVSLAAGRGYLAIPGPSVIPDAVLQAMHRPSPNIYAGELIDLTATLVPDLRRVARTVHNVAIYISNGHGAWEAALMNTLQPGDKVLVPASGRFALGWGEMAEALGIEVEILDYGTGKPWDMDQVASRLAADRAHQIKAVLAVHVDTSSSIRNDVAAMRACLDATGHPALLMADCIASLGCDRFEMDDWGVDVMVSACQKGLMVPAGMSFVFFSPKAAEARARLPRISRYWDWSPRANPEEFYQYFGGTAPTHHLYGLRAALDLIHGEGIEQVWARHHRLAQAIWAACEVWGSDGPLRMNVQDVALRSNAVTSLHIGGDNATRLRGWLEQNLGLTLGIGLGMAPPNSPEWHGYLRFGHMGHVNGQMIMGLLGGVDTGLKALGIAHGSGAVEAAAKVLAGVRGEQAPDQPATSCCG
ncbi:pyridoxal-phosphate-dependent aminotransferase family protein [Phaeobacter italicus]|uniref:pyridoxal-phosphate-dependent aminotransferase family protein n=1 Tax=Phaeobacter italicus TaxID=481446 RepID=UPI00066A103D|nr:aminotransferase class V-fold PLP-dependent enzyme [Phaeobacter italicus]CRL16643.1 Soluble hydrogenase 42 kDa subunit [Phaeobacter italicus]SFH26836.1 alanine-glyoxylate transaminase / serine-glyoxylate transaminase / serine-pyruvate transaminase [Phaeobacter italicus]